MQVENARRRVCYATEDAFGCRGLGGGFYFGALGQDDQLGAPQFSQPFELMEHAAGNLDPFFSILHLSFKRRPQPPFWKQPLHDGMRKPTMLQCGEQLTL